MKQITNYLVILSISLFVPIEYNLAQVEKGYKYIPEDNEYFVIFPQKPNIKSSTLQSVGEFETAELANNNENSIQRCEGFLYPDNYSSLINKEYVFNFIRNYADYNGLSYPEIHYEESDLGKIGTLRAFKELEKSNGKKHKVTYFAKVIFGDNSAIILYVGCLSEDYPTSDITTFLHSVQRNK